MSLLDKSGFISDLENHMNHGESYKLSVNYIPRSKWLDSNPFNEKNLENTEKSFFCVLTKGMFHVMYYGEDDDGKFHKSGEYYLSLNEYNNFVRTRCGAEIELTEDADIHLDNVDSMFVISCKPSQTQELLKQSFESDWESSFDRDEEPDEWQEEYDCDFDMFRDDYFETYWEEISFFEGFFNDYLNDVDDITNIIESDLKDRNLAWGHVEKGGDPDIDKLPANNSVDSNGNHYEKGELYMYNGSNMLLFTNNLSGVRTPDAITTPTELDFNLDDLHTDEEDKTFNDNPKKSLFSI